MTVKDLTPDQQEKFGRFVLYVARLHDEKYPGKLTDAQIYGLALEQKGLACHHPPVQRTRGYWNGLRFLGFDCGVCQARVAAYD